MSLDTKARQEAESTGSTPLTAACLVVAVLVLYSPVAGHEFVNFDDSAYVYGNTAVRAGLTWDSVSWAFHSVHSSNWHPLTWLSHMLDSEWFGLDAGKHHLVNVVIHAANSALLFVALRWMTGALWPSVLVAALFAFHPLRVESVAWVSERKDVLSGSFWMLTMLAWLRYVRRPSAGRYVLALLCLSLGLMAKPTLVTLPFVLLLLDIWPLERWRPWTDGGWPARRLLVEKIPLLVVSVASSLVTLQSQTTSNAVQGIDVIPVGARMANALVSYTLYLWKTLWPAGLACFYPHPASLPNDGSLAWVATAFAAGLALVAITVVVLRAMRRRPYLAVGWLWYLGTLIPVIGLFQVGHQALADRYTYLPLIGIYLMLAWGIVDLVARWPRARLAVRVLAPLVLLALAFVSHLQVEHWRNNVTLYEHAIQVTSQNFLAHNNLGKALDDLGDFDRAAEHFEQAVAIKPDYPEANYNLGSILQRRGDLDGARTHYERAVEYRSDYPEAHNNLGSVLAKQGQPAAALTHYHRAVEIRPEFTMVYLNIGNLHARQGDLSSAVTYYERVLDSHPDHGETHFNLAATLERHGDLERSERHYRKVIGLRPGHTRAHAGLGRVLERQGSADPHSEH